MTITEFQRILSTFADVPADVEVRRGEFVAQVHGTVLSGSLHVDKGDIIVTEAGDSFPASEWLIQRVARLPQLATRILENVPEVPHFVTPEGSFLDTLEESPDESPAHVPDSIACLRNTLSRRIPGASFVVYLTSDAGEGKTSVINHLARVKAQAYRDRSTEWLLLPVPLGGRTLLRFDDVMTGALVNRLRFPLWYFDALLELVRLGVVVPALDGFEEMFIESSTGEAVSSLGNLLRSLQSSGALLIAARKAYFEYKSFETQARLFDTIDTGDATFARLSLERWRRPQFLDYCDRRGITNGNAIYTDVRDTLGEDHALLTRAVLVRRLLDVATDASDRSALIGQVQAAPHDFFTQFVETIVDREIREKWINRVPDPAQPLLPSQDHYRLMSLVAQEMWTSNTAQLQGDVVDLVADIFCETKQVGVQAARQIKERLKQHALLVLANDRSDRYAFDHESFQEFFLGWGLGDAIANGAWPDLKRLFEVGEVADQALDTAVSVVSNRVDVDSALVESIASLSRLEGPATFMRTNVGGILIRLIDRRDLGSVHLSGLSFPPDSLVGRQIANTRFESCHIQPTRLNAAELRNCEFVGCTFERLELSTDCVVQRVRFDENTTTHGLLPAGSEECVYDPNLIEQHLTHVGIAFPSQAGPPPQGPAPEPDESLVTAQRGFRAFLRAVQVNENVLRLKMGNQAEEVIDQLAGAGILREVEYHGAGRQRRFRLAVQMRAIDDALSRCRGSFVDFLDLLNAT
ncbi:MAG: hypothetical protein KGY78_07545 [Anaerolineae bacterium]|nr:hypothetical protein [Anaerolineae bacterium]